MADVEDLAACLPSGQGDDEVELRVLVLQTFAGVAAAPAWRDHAAFSPLSATAASCLADDAAATRAAALAALAAFGERASAAHLDAAAALLEDEDASVRLVAIGALARLGSAESHGEVLSELLGDRDRGVRGAATAALKQWGLA